MSSVRVRYQTIEFGDVDIHLRTLRDRLEYGDESGVAENLGISSANWSLFGVIWPSSIVLARLMFDYDIKGGRVLEVGCGIGLSSLVLSHRGADITATDYHPSAEGYLQQNAALNSIPEIPFVRTGWKDESEELGLFDLIIGSDVLYEVGHIDALSNFINKHAHPTSTVVVVDPGRGQHARFSKRMVALGFGHSQYKPDDVPTDDPDFTGRILTYRRAF